MQNADFTGIFLVRTRERVIPIESPFPAFHKSSYEMQSSVPMRMVLSNQFLRTFVVCMVFEGTFFTMPSMAQVPDPIENPTSNAVEDTKPAVPPSVEPSSIPLEPSPILDQPSLFPNDPAAAPIRATEAIPRQGTSLVRSAQPPEMTNPTLDSSFTGAASSFGLDARETGLSRPSVAASQADRERQRLIARAERQAALQHYNFKLGPIPFRFGAGLDVQVTDNVNLSSKNKQADLIVIPHLNLFGAVQLTSKNTLTIELSLGYIWDLNRPDQSRALTNASVGLDSDAGISFDIKMGNFRINVHEKPSIPRQQFDLITQRNPIQYAQFTNLAGVSVFWDMNSRISASFQYDHFNSISLKSEVENLDQSADNFGASVSFRMSDSLSLGLQGNASIVKYSQPFLNDAKTYNVGATVLFKASRNISVRGAVGFQFGQFGSRGATGDSSGLNEWYANVDINHSINEYVTQVLSVGREAQLGTASNSTEVLYIRHRASLAILNRVSIGTTCSFESANESGGLFAQEFKFFQFGVFSYWSISKKIGLSLQYRFLKRDSSSAVGGADGQLDYIENRLDIGMQFIF